MSNLKYCIKESIINGLSWLSKNQNNDGSFGDIYKITIKFNEGGLFK